MARPRQLPRNFAANLQEDILVEIFLFLSNDPKNTTLGDRFNDGWDWTCILQVCRRWYAISKETPRLWSYFHPMVLINADRTNHYLRLSKDTDLTLEFSSFSFYEAGFGSPKDVLREMRRIRHISIEMFLYQDEQAELFALLDQPAPRAESIALTMSDVSDAQRFQFPITVPGVLQRVELTYMNLSANMSRLARLTSLHISYCKYFSLAELFAVLETSTELLSLQVSWCQLNPSIVSTSVLLPCLLNVRLEFTHFAECYSLLSNIDAPNVLKWYVNCEKELGLDDVLKLEVFSKLLEREFYFDMLQIATPRLRGSPSIQVKLINAFPEVDTGGASLYLSFDRVDLNSVILRLIEVFRSALGRAYILDIAHPDDSVTVDTWRAVLCASGSALVVHALVGNTGAGDGGDDDEDEEDEEEEEENVDAIVGENENEDIINYLKALCPTSPCPPTVPQAGQRAANAIPCPSAEHLKIQWLSGGADEDVDRLLLLLEDVVRTRAEHGCTVHKLSVFSHFVVPEEDERLEALSRWVREVEWKNDSI